MFGADRSSPLSDSYMNAEKYGLDRIYFGGCFIRGMLNFVARRDPTMWLIPLSLIRSCIYDLVPVVRY
jgi:hypothetical protein